MKNLCPYCNKKTNIDIVHTNEIVNVKGDTIEIKVKFFKCNVCGQEFEDQNSDYDPIKEAYKKYRAKHNMVQPEDIKVFRKKYGLSQKELSAILGWGGATLSRYENGALQDETHNTVLQLIMNPENLLYLIRKKTEVLSSKTRNKFIKKLTMISEEL